MANVIVCGRMKEGKTTLAMHLANEWSPGVVFWDPRHQTRVKDATYVYTADELEDAIQDEAWRKGPIIFRPNGLQLAEDFEAMATVLFNPPDRFDNFTLIVDEASGMQSAHTIAPHLALAVRQHPRSVLIIQTSHSLQDWYRTSKDLTNDLYVFRLRGKSLAYVIDFCDGSAELEETIKNLPRHHLVHICFEASDDEKEFEVIDDPASWYEDVIPGESNSLPEKEPIDARPNA